MTTEDPNDFGNDFPPPPERAPRNLPIATLLITAGLAALILLLVFSY